MLNLVLVDVQDFTVYQIDAVVTNRYSDYARGSFTQWKRICDMALSAEIKIIGQSAKTYLWNHEPFE